MTIFSQSGGFLFISNTKVASSTIHHLLYPVADAVFYRPERGKHFSYAQARALLKRWGGPDASALFRFGVVRDPVDWMRSWYKFRSRPDMRANGGAGMPDGLSFETFVEAAITDAPADYASIRKQATFFSDRAGTVQMDFLATLDGIAADCRLLARYPALAPLDALREYRVNVSDTTSDLTLTARTRSRLEAFLAADCELYQSVRDGKFRTLPEKLAGASCTFQPDGPDRVEDAISRMTLAANLGHIEEAAEWARRIPGDFALDANSRSVLRDLNGRAASGQETRPPRQRWQFWRRT